MVKTFITGFLVFMAALFVARGAVVFAQTSTSTPTPTPTKIVTPTPTMGSSGSTGSTGTLPSGAPQTGFGY